MPGCVLRVVGSTLKVQRFLSISSFSPTIAFRKGERRFTTSKHVDRSSGFNLLLSGSEGITKQAQGAVRFIIRHKDEFDRLKAFRFKGATLDFGLYYNATPEYPWPTYALPRNLVALAGAYGFDIEISFYGQETG